MSDLEPVAAPEDPVRPPQRRHSLARWGTRAMVVVTVVTLLPLGVLGLVAVIATGETKEWDRPWAEQIIDVFWLGAGAWLLLAAMTVLLLRRRRRDPLP